jgi:hypothetical protein
LERSRNLFKISLFYLLAVSLLLSYYGYAASTGLDCSKIINASNDNEALDQVKKYLESTSNRDEQ